MSFTAPSSIPAHGLTPRVLTGIFVQIVRNIFSDRENIVNPEIFEFLWTDNAGFSNMLIEDLYRW